VETVEAVGAVEAVEAAGAVGAAGGSVPPESAAAAAARVVALQAVRRLGGTRLRLVAVGGAVVPPSQLDFLRACFGAGGAGGGRAVVSDGYGMTEVPGGIARDGLPQPGVTIKLVPLSGGGGRGGGGGGGGRGGGGGGGGRGGGGGGGGGGRGAGLGEILVRTSRGGIVGGTEGGAPHAARTQCSCPCLWSCPCPLPMPMPMPMPTP